MSKSWRKKLLHDHCLTVLPTVDPELILWQNYGLSKEQKVMRGLVYLGYVLFLLLSCFYGVLYLENWIAEKETHVLGIDCPKSKNFTAEMAWADYNDPNANGPYHCFCKALSELPNWYEEIGKLAFADGELRNLHCDDWFISYW